MAHIRHGLSDQFLPFIEISPKRILRLPVKALLAAVSTDDTVTPEAAKKILLVSGENAIDVLGRSGHLRRVHKNGTREWQVDRASLDELLVQQLEGSIELGEWKRRNLLETRPPFTKQQVIKMYHVDDATIEAEIAAGRLPHIRTAGGWTIIPQWSLDGFIERRTAWNEAKVSALLGVPEDIASDWIAKKTLCNARHGGARGTCPSSECLRRYITDNRTSTSFNADDWLT